MSALEHIHKVMKKSDEYLTACGLGEREYSENDLDTLALVAIAESLAGIEIQLARLADAAEDAASDSLTGKMVELYRGGAAA